MFEQGARIPVAAHARTTRVREAVGEHGPTALQELEARGRVEMAAQHELERERALVVAGVGEQELLEASVAALGDSVRLAGATARLRGHALAGGGEVAVERTGRG